MRRLGQEVASSLRRNPPPRIVTPRDIDETMWRNDEIDPRKLCSPAKYRMRYCHGVAAMRHHGTGPWSARSAAARWASDDGETITVTTPACRDGAISRRARYPATIAALLALCLCAASPAVAAGVTGDAARWLGNAPQQIQTFMLAAYDKAPALVLVLGALFVMPMTALLAFSAMTMRDRMPRPALRAWRGAGPDSFTRRTAKSAPVTIAAWPASAWLAIDGGARVPLPKSSGLIRLGRHEDNDIRLPDTSVHRHHAIVHRTAAAEFVITDLSGATGNGVIVNGERVAQSNLLSGDVIDLGGARLTFESIPV